MCGTRRIAGAIARLVIASEAIVGDMLIEVVGRIARQLRRDLISNVSELGYGP
jgi:hypothetical protein